MSSSKFNGLPQDSESEGEVNFAQEVGSDNDADSNVGETRGSYNNTSKQQQSQDGEEDEDGDSDRQSRRRHVDNVGDDEDEEPSNTNTNIRSNQSNPQSVPGEDNDEDDDGDDNDEATGGRNKDDNEDEDDEDDDDDEDEDEQVQSHRRKRQKKNRRNQFIDVEAEVDEDEDDADEDEDELPPGFVADDEPPEDGDAEGDDRDDRRHRELDQRRQEEENLSAEQLAAKLQDRYSGYGRNRAAAADATILPQRMLLPSVEDPTIWGVRVKPGKEREVVFAVTRRIELQMFSPQPLAITAAFERGGTMAGYVYVEARRQADVMVALEGLPSAYPRTNMVRVPIQEMPDLLRVSKTKMLEPGMYVRIKRGKYQGDLAQVEEVEANGLEVECRLVPREDYGLNEDAHAPGSMSPHGKRKRQAPFGKNSVATRPPQRLFNEHEARKKNGRYLQQVDAYKSKHFNYMGNVFIAGFLHKSFRVQLLQTENVNPTLEEVTKFTASAEDGTENLDLAALAATLKSSTAGDSYLPGDKVEISHGEQRGVVGKAISVHGDIVTLKVTEGDLAGQTLESPVKSLNKIFKEGDHVKVIGGSKYQDEVGMVVRVKDGRVTLLSDSSNQEITVFSRDLRASTEAGIVTSGSKYDLFDLVQLDPATVACVIKVDRESLKVLDQNGTVRSLLPSNISNKLERRRFAVTTDKDGTEIRNDDTVKEAGGDQRQGRVMHIHRSYLFIQNRQQNDNAGIFVARSSSVLTVAAKAGRGNNAGPDLSKMNPNIQRNGANGGPGATSNAMAPSKPMGRDRLVGKSCKIKSGQYKGLLGIVKDTTDSHARIELHSKSKTITVPKETLNLLDPVTGQPLDMNKFGNSRPPPAQNGPPKSVWGGGATPARVPDAWDGGRTPMNGGKTPAWSASASGGRTPGWKQGAPAGGRTPAAWNDGSRTVNPYGDGSRTAYGGATSYGGGTWNPNASTPFHSSTFQSGSRTPAAWDIGNRTPANQNYNAPTPGFSAPTPGASGDYEDYAASRNPYGSVPAGSAPTPSAFGGFNARTPGATVGDEDEGYE